MPHSKCTKNVQPFNPTTVQLYDHSPYDCSPFTYHPKVEQGGLYKVVPNFLLGDEYPELVLIPQYIMWK